MAIKKVVDIEVKNDDAKQVDKSFKEINKTLKEVDKNSKKALSGDNLKKVNNEIKNTEKAAVSVKTRLRELEDEMANIGDVGSPQFQKIAAEAGVLRDKMNNAKAAIKSMSADFPKLQVGMQAFNTLGGGAQAATGAVQLLGSENEALAKGIQKMMAIQSILNGVNAVANALSDETALGLKVRTMLTNLKTASDKKQAAGVAATSIAQKGLNVAQAAGAVGMRILNAVMNANPIFLLITGVTAFVGLLVYFTKETAKAADMNDRLNESYAETNKLVDSMVDKTRKRVKHEGEMLAATGATEKELHENRIKQLKIEELAREAQIKIEAAYLQDKRAALNQARREGNDELVEEIKSELDASQAKYDELVAQNGDYYNKLEVENAKFQKHQEAERQKEIAAEKAAYDKRVGEWKAFQNRRLAVQREIENARIGAMFEGQQKELATLEAQAKNRREDILADTTITEEEKEALIRAYEDQRQIARADIRAKYVEQERQAERDAAAARAEIANIPPPIPEFEQIEEVDLVEQEEIKLGLLDEIKTKWRSKEYQDNLEHLKGMEEQSQNYFAAVQQGLSAMSDLNDLLTDQAVKKAKGNAQAEEAARKKGFERGKKIQLVSAVITGIQGVMAAFTAGASMGPAGVVMGPLMAGLAAVTAGVNIAKIASQKYEGGGGGGGGAAPRAPSVPSQPSFNAVGAGGANQLAESLGSQNEQAPVKAYVVGADVTSQQSLDRNKTENASI